MNLGDVPTCWSLDSDTGALPTTTPFGTAAAESALCSSQHPLKYSFTLGDTSSSNGTRVAGLTATLKDNGDNVINTRSETLSNLTVGISQMGSNFSYTGTNGANGTFGLLTSSGPGYNTGCTSEPASVNGIQGGLVARCGTVSGCGTIYDSFAGNDGVGGDLAAWTALSASSGLNPAGSPYSLDVMATLKSSVSGLASLPISVCASVTVDAGQCTPTQQPACP